MDEKNINDINNENENPNNDTESTLEVNGDTAVEAVNENAVSNVDCNITADENIVDDSDTGFTAPSEAPNISAIEEPPEPSLDSYKVSRNEPAAYAFRWDYGEQRYYDGMTKRANKASRGVAVYAVILTVTFLLAIAVLIGSLVFGDYLSSTPARDPLQYGDDLSLDALYDHCLPSYVAISVLTNSGTEGVGSGIVITEDGYISTNYHVVENAKKITVITSNGTKYDAQYIDGDEVNDIAVIKVSAKRLTPAVLGSSSNTKVGERVMAIGTPHDIDYAGSMTSGYVSGIERQYQVMNANGTVSKTLKLIQTDTTVNPGNSGGPLFNMNGEVIGVVVLKITGGSYEGMGFALPIDGVRGMIFDIIENGKITDENSGSAFQGAALGISGHEIKKDTKYLMTADYCIEVHTDDKGDYIEISLGSKIYITDTEALNAVGLEGAYPYKAPCTGVLIKTTSKGFDSNEKLKFEDIITAANGIACDSMATLQGIIFNSRVGDVLQLEVYRNNEYISVDVELGLANSME